jgi:hypothetical protein
VIAPGKLTTVVIRDSDPIRPHHRPAAAERLPAAGQEAVRSFIFAGDQVFCCVKNWLTASADAPGAIPD